jgi:hypothetical protein
MRDWLYTLRHWIWPGKRTPMTPLPPRVLRKVAQQIEMTQSVEYSCDDVHRLLDQFAEAVWRGEDATKLMPLVQSHLDMCPDCREEFEALMRILHASLASPA